MSSSKIFYAISTGIVFLLLSIYFFHPVTNLVGDLGYYLKIGEIIFQTKTVPSTNLFSYTYPNYPFINPNWLSEVIFYICFGAFGFNGLIILSVLLIVGAFFLIFITAARKFDVLTTIIIALIYIHVLYERTEIKPELFSFLFLSIFITILYRYKERYTKWIFALTPLELLWANFHIYFFVGIVVLLLFLIDALISKKDSFNSKRIFTLSAVTLASGLVTLFNPNILKGATYPFFVLNNYAFPVEENANFFSVINYGTYDPTLIFFGISVAILWIGIFVSIKKMKPIDILLSLVFTFMGFFAVRAFSLFVFGTFIPSIKAISPVMQLIYNKIERRKILLIKVTFFTLICILLMPTIKLNMSIHGVGLGVIDESQDAINFLRENNLKGKIYNNYDIGNYLDYRFYPKEKVFVDGRPEAYPKEFFENMYFPMQESLVAFNKEADRYKFNILFIGHTDTSPGTVKLLSLLIADNNWKMVYLNNSIVIFLRNIPSNQAVIKRYLINEKNVTISKSDFNDKNKVRRLVNFFRAVNWNRPWLSMNLRYLNFEPNNCNALQNVAYILQKQNNPNAIIYINRYTQTCLQQ